TVISMTSRARRRTEIAANRYRLVMHAFGVLGELIRRDSVGPHVFSVRVATRTCLGDLQWVYLGPCVSGWAKIVHAVTIDAHRDVGVALRETLAVHAGLVLGQLVGPQGRVVLAYERGVRMTAAAEFRNLTAFDLAAEPSCLAHGVHVGLGRIAAMAARAG